MEPIKFNALLKSTIWGGEKIIPFKHLNVEQENVGESWEISGVPGNETVVANGPYAGPFHPGAPDRRNCKASGQGARQDRDVVSPRL